MKTNWMEVDREGLAQVVADRPKSFLLFELIQNALDEQVTKVDVHVTKEGKGKHRIVVADDSPDGYQDIRHAWTLFAPSKKKADATLRGRFNVGCKMVLALADFASVVSTKAAVEFTAKDGRRETKDRTERGTVFTGVFNMTVAEAAEACDEIEALLPPHGVTVTIHSAGGTVDVPYRTPVKVANDTLPTVRADDEGILRKTRRKADIELHEVQDGEKAHLFEMGIPVVELDGQDPFHINVQQRVPLNTDRDNVTPAYLRTLRVVVLNAAHDCLDKDQAEAVWATEASEDERATSEAVNTVLDHRFGEKRVAYDLSDPEANMLAVSKGYTVVAGGSLTKGQWANAKAGEGLLPAGRVTPSPRVLASAEGVKAIPEAEWGDDMKDVARVAGKLASDLDVHPHVSVTWYDDAGLDFAGAWGGGGRLSLNRRALRHSLAQYRKGNGAAIVELLIHEFAHEREGNHLDERYHDELSRLGAACFYLKVEDYIR